MVYPESSQNIHFQTAAMTHIDSHGRPRTRIELSAFYCTKVRQMRVGLRICITQMSKVSKPAAEHLIPCLGSATLPAHQRLVAHIPV